MSVLCDKNFHIPEQPSIPGFNRKGFYVVEWGVVLLDVSL